MISNLATISHNNGHLHPHQTLQTTKNQTMRMSNRIHSTSKTEVWADCWIPAVLYGGDEKLRTNILKGSQWTKQLTGWLKCGALLIGIKLYYKHLQPAVLEATAVFSNNVRGCAKPSIQPSTRVLLPTPFTPPSAPIAAKMHEFLVHIFIFR
jgi:hypothetical protein